MKKFALRAMAALAVALALCVFFSGTVRTITTPKVKFVSGKMGKFRSETALTAKLEFKNVKEYSLTFEGDYQLKIKKLYVSAGDEVHEGDKLFTSSVVDYEDKMQELAAQYDSQEETLRQVLLKTASIRLTRNEKLWMEAYYANKDASAAYRDARVEVSALLALKGLSAVEEGYPEGADDETKVALDTMRACKEVYDAAAQELENLSRYAIADEDWTLLCQQKEGEEKLQELESDMTALSLLSKETAVVYADRDFYVTEVAVSKGDSVGTEAVLFRYSSTDSAPFLRADITKVSETVGEGTLVSVETSLYGDVTAEVSSVTVNADGSKSALIPVSDDVCYGFGGLENMLSAEISLKITARAKESTCLLPASAVRGSDGDRYVFVANKVTSTFGGTQLKAVKQSVTVLNESEETVSVSEDLCYAQVIYGEDRVISDGDTVMENDG